ncbi:S1 family peptidase [Promicromonospora sp. NPDC057488]|uniref:S1 family peptidase n=1 Tax=Promicromonospora sp. NPDC057488 TaxID=3346147 RepID=UPI00366AB323
MRTKEIAIVMSAVATTLAMTLAGPSAASSAPSDPRTPAGYLADPTDPAVTSLAAEYDISVEEAQARIGWQEAAIELHDRLAVEDAEHFGGLWFDQADGGRVKIGVVGSTSETRDAVDAAGISNVTSIVPVENTWAQLTKDLLELEVAAKEISYLSGHAGQVAGIATKPSENRNVLYVPDTVLAARSAATVVDSLRESLGSRLAVDSSIDATTVHDEACMLSPRTCDAPLRGGINFHTVNTDIGDCSTAFNARSVSDGNWYMMTAGHCGYVDHVFDVYQLKTSMYHRVGHMHSRNDSNNDDWGIVTINNVSGWAPRNWVRVYDSADTVPDESYTITATATSPEGTRVCLSGKSTGTSCGDVVELNLGGTGGWARAHYCHDPGDSGGAVYSNHRARGIHTGVWGTPIEDDQCHRAIFQGVVEVEREANVRVYTG